MAFSIFFFFSFFCFYFSNIKKEKNKKCNFLFENLIFDIPQILQKTLFYIYMLWGYYLVQVWPFWKLLSGPSLFFLKHRLPKNTIKIGVSALFFWKKNCAQKFWKLLSGPSWRFLRRSQLGPDNNFQLGPDNNFQKCHFFVIFCFEKCAKMPIFIVFFEKQPKNAKKNAQKKTITFHILQNTGS